MTNKLNKFTTYKYVLCTLNNGLFFSDGKNWPDKNDSELIELFRKQSDKDVKAACLMQEDETIYHWQSFANESCPQEVCCIEFDSDKLLSIYKPENGYISDFVNYASIEDVVFDSPLKLLFTKRLPYRYEKEFRIVHIGNKEENIPQIDIDSFRKAITKITMSGNLSQEEYHQRKEYLMSSFSLNDNQINQSTIEKNPFWINKAIIHAQSLDCKNLADCVHKDTPNKKSKICQENYLVRIEHFKNPESSNDIFSTIATIHTNDYVVAMGAMKNIDDTICSICGNCKFNTSIKKAQYEFIHFIRDDYKNKGLLDVIIKELLRFYEDKKILAIVKDSEKEVQNSLAETFFFEDGKQGDEILYIKNPQ